MPDRSPLEGIDGPRPLPPSLRARIEAELVGSAAGDTAEPLPEGARRRLAARLADPAAALLDGVDGPRPLSSDARTRIEAALAAPGRPRRRRRAVRVVGGPAVLRRPMTPWLAAAACLALLVASATVLRTRPHSPTAAPDANSGQTASGSMGASLDEGGPDAVATPFTDKTPAVAASGPGANISAPHAAGARAGSVSAGSRRQPPPFAYEMTTAASEPAAALASPNGTSTTTTTAPPPPFRYKALTGDPVEQAGFNAYVNLLNDTGGAGGRRFVSVTGNADITVNLSGTPFDERTRPTGIGLDAFLAPESSLRGDVFAFGGVPERQAHLIADAVYPDQAPPNTTAAVYRPADGPLGTTVADAVDEVLRSRGVRPVDVVVQRGRPIVAVAADAVFLVLEPADADDVIAAYAGAPAPTKGFNGVGTLADASAPSGLWVVSPYSLKPTDEAKELTARSRRPLSARLIHGWVAAKTLAVAVYQSDPRTPAVLKSALENMDGYANGFAPASYFRPGTHAVRPDGVLIQSGVEAGPFRTDKR